MGRGPCPAPGRCRSLTRFACERLAAGSEPAAKCSLQILPGTCQLPPVLHPACLSFPERPARRSNPAFPRRSSRCNSRALPAELRSGDQCDISAPRQRSAPAALRTAMAQCPARQVSHCNFSECCYSGERQPIYHGRHTGKALHSGDRGLLVPLPRPAP